MEAGRALRPCRPTKRAARPGFHVPRSYLRAITVSIDERRRRSRNGIEREWRKEPGLSMPRRRMRVTARECVRGADVRACTRVYIYASVAPAWDQSGSKSRTARSGSQTTTTTTRGRVARFKRATQSNCGTRYERNAQILLNLSARQCPWSKVEQRGE